MTNNKSSIISKANQFIVDGDYITFSYNDGRYDVDTIKISIHRLVEDWLQNQTLIDWEEDDDFGT